jgi:hypothetical protein
MGKPSRDKGARRERELVAKAKAAGLFAERVPLSGAAGGSYTGDVRVADRLCEVKARASGEGFVTIERWLGDNDALVLWRDRSDPLVVVPLTDWLKLLGEQECRKST